MSLDFIYTSWRNHEDRRVGMKGTERTATAQQRKPIYTDCIITAVRANGEQLPPVLFTLNRTFIRRNDYLQCGRYKNPTWTKAMEKSYNETNDLVKSYHLDWDHLHYHFDMPRNTSKKFTKECSDIVKSYFVLMEKHFSKDTLIFHDAGTCFAKAKQYVLNREIVGCFKEYPAAIHEILSWNDNRLHGVAKAKWRSMKHHFKNDAEASLALIDLLRKVPKESIKRDFERNFAVSLKGNARTEKIQDLLSGTITISEEKRLWFKRCSETYRTYKGDRHLRSSILEVDTTKALPSQFTGPKWR